MKKKTVTIQKKAVVIISANAEWKVIREIYPKVILKHSPFGEWFSDTISIRTGKKNAERLIKIIYFHGGWGKIAAAASTQYVIDCWKPELLLNFGTCGGFQGDIDRGTIILAEKTIVYDIYELMYPLEDHVDHYSSDIDLSWLADDFPIEVRKTLLVSGDRDLSQKEIPELKAKYHAVAGDWESGAIAHVAKLNNTPVIILRGVSDLVSDAGGEAYNNVEIFESNTQQIIKKLVENLPEIISSSKFL